MELAVNYSNEAAKLLREGRIRVDRLKCPDWPDMIVSARALAPVHVHFPLQAGDGSAASVDFAAVAAMARDTDTPFVNTHLIARPSDFPHPPTRAQVIERMLGDINIAAAAVGRERLIAENIPVYPGEAKHLPICAEADVIREAVESADCGFLFDLSHARVAAHYQSVDPHGYIRQLPMHRLRELHVTGLKTIDDRLTDHMELSDEDWRWMDWVMQRIRGGEWPTPWAVAFEYGGLGEPFRWRSEERIIAEQVPRLYEMIHAV